MCMSVDLPEPDGPMIALKRPSLEGDAHAVERVDRGRPPRRSGGAGRVR